MKIRVLILTLAIAAVAPTLNAATLYKWTDEFGNVTYRDTPPPEGVEYQQRSISGGQGTEDSGESAAAAEQAPITIYTTPNCSACDSVRNHLQKRGVPFEEKNVEGNGEMQQELKAKAGELSVPTILVGTKVMRGYVQTLLDGELDAAGYPKAGGGEGAEPAPETPQ